MMDHVDEFKGHEVNWFTLGESDQSLEVEFSKTKNGHCFITYTSKNGTSGHAFDCAMGKFHDGNKIAGYHNHKGGNQWFIVNEDLTISPTHACEMVLGIRNIEGKIYVVLVKNTDDENKLVFNTLVPT